MHGDLSTPQIFSELSPDPALNDRIGGQVPADGLIERMAIEIKGGFDQFTIGGGSGDRPPIGKPRRE